MSGVGGAAAAHFGGGAVKGRGLCSDSEGACVPDCDWVVQAWAVLPPHIAAAVGALDDKSFTSDQHVPTTHEHYIKVLHTFMHIYIYIYIYI